MMRKESSSFDWRSFLQLDRPVPWFKSVWFIVFLALPLLSLSPGLYGGILIIAYLHWSNDKKFIEAYEENESIRRQLQDFKERGLDKVVDQQEAVFQLVEEERILEGKLKKLRQDYIELDEEVLYQSYGIYRPQYDFANAATYKEALKEVRTEQKQMVRQKEATHHSYEWTVDGDKRKGKKMINDTIRLALRAFNHECDVIISKVTVNNYESSQKRIWKSQEMINRMNESNHVAIKDSYVDLKIEELQLALEWELQKEKEKEELRERRAAEREEKRIAKEIAAEKKKIEKEEKHFQQALEKMKKRLKLEEAQSEEMRALQEKIAVMESQLSEKQKEKEDLDYRSTHTRAGYVYIVSNIGSLGKDIYKIGMTRRLEPMERIRELSSASVPFKYDVHAMIFSEDAPTLEKKLHEQFDEYRVNKVNNYKEFFQLPLKEIEKAVKKYHDQTVDFTHITPAEEYRATQALVQEERVS